MTSAIRSIQRQNNINGWKRPWQKIPSPGFLSITISPTRSWGAGNAGYLAGLFEKYKVNAVFSGHLHNYQRRVINGITYIITAGGGAPLYPMDGQDETRLAAVVTYHFVDLTIDGKKLVGSVITPEGKEIDHFTITLP